MTVRTMLIAASGGSASDGAIETACRIAGRLGARLEALHVKADPTQIVTMAAEGYTMPVAGEWIDRVIADADALAKRTEAAFAAAAARHNLPLAAAEHGPSAAFRVETGYGPHLVARHARFFDLVVLGRSERVVERPHSDAIEETLTRSGRPVLLAPAKPPATIGRAVAFGWNGSAEAVHALAAAMTLFEKADAVTVITVGTEEEDPQPVIGYLAWHGVTAKRVIAMPVAGVDAGEQLLSEARNVGADLLVMGAYGHRPWREILFGGATRRIIGTSLLPVLLAH
ncbi:MAG: universal stress protein [Stellaceae bacterium]